MDVDVDLQQVVVAGVAQRLGEERDRVRRSLDIGDLGERDERLGPAPVRRAGIEQGREDPFGSCRIAGANERVGRRQLQAQRLVSGVIAGVVASVAGVVAEPW